VMVDADGGEEVGRMLYDSFGGVLTSTLPLTLTGTLSDTPDAATGLVHLGGGRWYDSALGRPLQPNPAGGPPTVPQVLNRYTATAVGQPGVYQAANKSDLTALSLAVGASKSSAAEVLSRATWGILGNPTSTDNLIDAANLAKEGRYTAAVGVNQIDEVVSITRSPRLAGLGNIKLGLATDVLLSAGFQYVGDSYNPYFTTQQRFERMGIAGLGGLGSSLAGLGAGSLACGSAAGACFAGAMVTIVTTVGVNAVWSYVAQPFIFQNVERFQPPPRNLIPLDI